MRISERRLEAGSVTIVVFDKGEDAIEGLTELARRRDIHAAGITGVGAFERATLGYFDRERKDYDRIPVAQQVEVLSLTGDIALDDGDPMVHLHAVLGRRDGSTVGGHLIDSSVWPTLEIVVTETPEPLHRVHDPESGLALIRPVETDM